MPDIVKQKTFRNSGKQVNQAKPVPQQIQRGRAGPRARHADPSLLQRRTSKTLGETKENKGSLRSRCVMRGMGSEGNDSRTTTDLLRNSSQSIASVM